MKTAFLLPLLVKFAAAKTISYKGIQEEDQVVTTTDNYSWGLDRLNQRKLPLDHVYHRAKFSGKGIDVYVIDTGINPNEYYNFTCHNFYPGKDDCTTTHYHGTHVGSLIGSKIFGVAPGVNIINLRVLGDNGSGMVSTVVEAIDFILRTKVTCAIINMSIGAGKSEILNMKTNELAAAGNAVVVAAGNSYGDACNYSPSSASGAITVGAVDDNDAFASFTNTGACVDVYAPGVKIIGATGGSKTMYLSGTSMSSPLMAGAVAIQMERKNRRRQRCKISYRRTKIVQQKKIGYVGH